MIIKSENSELHLENSILFPQPTFYTSNLWTLDSEFHTLTRMNTTNLLQSLSEVGLKIQNAENSGSNVSRSKFIKQLTVTSNHIQELRSLEAKDSKQQIWDQLSPLGISLTNASQALAAVLSEAPQAKASQFAAWYMALLATPGCPVCVFYSSL